jgi:hypothetical protein
MVGRCSTTVVRGVAKAALVRVGRRCHPPGPVGTRQAARNTRVPCRRSAGARFSGWPGCSSCVGDLRGRICRPGFASVQIPRRASCSKRRAWRYRAQIAWAWASQAGAWLVSQSTLRCGLRSAASRPRQRGERLRPGDDVWVRSVAALSSTLQRGAGQWASAGLLVALALTVPWAAGGKAPGPTWPRRILKPDEPLREIAGAPQTHGMAITVHLGSKAARRRRGGGGCPEEQATTACQRVRGRLRAGERLQLCPCLVRSRPWGSIRYWHGSGPCRESGKTDSCLL